MDPVAAADTWERAVALGARGMYAAAHDSAATIVDARDRWSSLALSTLASHRRQIGDTRDAARLDAEALECATDPESRADALIGLAADAVATGASDQAAARHAEAADDATATWRTLTRWHWVGAELALLVGDPAAGAAHARRACAASSGASTRHEAKSRIILAAVTGHAAELAELSPVLRRAGWTTLEWPLALVAADHASGVPAGWLAEAWESGRRATYAIEEGLPAEQRVAWRAHPGVRRLRHEGVPMGDG